MSRIMRVIVYEGSEENMERQLAKSLSVGHHFLMTGITIVELRNPEAIRNVAACVYLHTVSNGATPPE